MKKLFAGVALTASLAFIGSAALADGMPRRAMAAPASNCCCASGYNWSGFYIGAQVGQVDFRSHFTSDLATPLIGGTTVDQDTGWLAGGQIGFNRQTCMAVWGIEADLVWADAGRRQDSLIGLTRDNQVNWIGTIRSRAGIAVDNLLLFVTGGVAFADFDHRFGIIGGPNITDDSDVRWGWVAGAGAEYALRDNISLRSDVLFASFEGSSREVDIGSGPPTIHFRNFDDIWMIRTALNFKLGGDRRMEAAPLK